MTHNRSFRPADNLIVRFLLILLFMLSVSGLHAQSPTDFSGQWTFDISKSKPGEGGTFGSSDITHNISQDLSSITIEEIIGKEGVPIVDKFDLDGKETIEKKDYGTTKKSAVWSQDKKTLTLTTIMTIDGKDYRSDDLYKLSDNGLVLTVQSVSKIPTGESTTVWVYNRKKNQN